MPETPEQTTRTPGQDDGDALENTGTAGTPEQDERDAGNGKGPSDDDLKALILANKQTIEQLRRERDEAMALAQRGPQPAADAEQANADDEETVYQNLKRLSAVDPAAKAALILMERQRRAEQNTMDALTLSRLPSDKQQPMLDFYERNRRFFPTLADAVRYVNGKQAEEENARLRKEVEELKARGPKKEEAERDVVRTAGHDVSAAKSTKLTVSKDDFDQRQLELKSQGRFEEARAEQGKLRRGEIILKG